MKSRVFDIAYAALNLFLLLAFGIAVSKAQQDQNQSTLPIFMPVVFKENITGNIIEGKGVNPQDMPMAGVTICTNIGQQVLTDQNGAYRLDSLSGGSDRITPSQAGWYFHRLHR